MALWLGVTEGVFYAALLVTVLLYGGGFVEGHTLLQALTTILGISLCVRNALSSERFFSQSMKLLFLLLVLWIFYLWFQLFPIPASLVSLISPNRVKLLEQFSLTPLAPSNRIPLSFGTYGMQVEFGKLISYAALFFIAYTLIQDRSSVRRFALVVVGIGLVVSFVGLLFRRIGPNFIYDFQMFERSNSMAPFVNKNQFANYVMMTIPVTLASIFLFVDRSSLSTLPSWRKKVLWLASREAMRVLLLIGIFVLQFAALLASASRGGFAGLLIGFVTFVALLAIKSRKLGPSLFVGGILVVVVMLGLNEAKPLLVKIKSHKITEATAEDFAVKGRLSNWKDTIRMFADFPAVGIGPGGFKDFFPLYKTTPEYGFNSQLRFFYAENHLLQGLAETGIVGMGLLTFFGFILLRRFLQAWMKSESKTVHWLFLGVVSACFGMLGHSLVDFPMGLAGNMALFASFGGLLARLGGGFKDDALNSEAPPLSTWMGARRVLAALGLIAFCVFLAAPFLWRQWRSEYYFLKAEQQFEQIKENKELSSAAVRFAYESLLCAERIDGSQARIHHDLGRAYFAFGLLSAQETSYRNFRFKQAEAAFLEAITRAPFRAAYRFSLGELYVNWGLRGKATEHFEKASLLEPQNILFRYRLGSNLIHLGEKDKAQKLFAETLKVNVSYLTPILESIVSASGGKTVENLHEFMLQDNLWQQFQGGIANYFTVRNQHETAETVRKFSF